MINLPELPSQDIGDGEIRVWTTSQLQGYALQAISELVGRRIDGWTAGTLLENAIDNAECAGWHEMVADLTLLRQFIKPELDDADE